MPSSRIRNFCLPKDQSKVAAMQEGRREQGTMWDDNQASEYDNKSESECRNLESEDTDEMTFIQAVTT